MWCLMSAKRCLLLFSVAVALTVIIPVFSVSAAPFIGDILPPRGKAGDHVFINGGNFLFSNLSSNKVIFSGGVRAGVISAKTDQLCVTVPNGAASGPVTLNSSLGSVTSPNSFEIMTASARMPTTGGVLGRGDRKVLDTYLDGFQAVKEDGKTYFAPPESVLYVEKVDSTGNATVYFKQCSWWQKGCKKLKSPKEEPEPAEGAFKHEYEVQHSLEYKIDSAKLQDSVALTQGFDYGLLVLPFKYHFSDQALTGEATLGGYAGYQLSWPGVAVTMPVLSAGLGVVNIVKQEGSSVTSSSAPSLTVAYGMIINLSKSGLFQIGVISGFDWAGRGSQYKYEGKPWISVSFGTNFTK
jgi:hypothetical protein